MRPGMKTLNQRHNTSYTRGCVCRTGTKIAGVISEYRPLFFRTILASPAPFFSRSNPSISEKFKAGVGDIGSVLLQSECIDPGAHDYYILFAVPARVGHRIGVALGIQLRLPEQLTGA